jgi:hypothetical protein
LALIPFWVRLSRIRDGFSEIWLTHHVSGFNRGRNNRTNTYSAILEANKRASQNIVAIELGNEPDRKLTLDVTRCVVLSCSKLIGYLIVYLMWEQPIATAPWNETQEGQDNANWAQGFIDIWPGNRPILLGGSYAVPIPLQPNWPNTDYLINTAYNETVKSAIKEYSGHLYALSNGTELKGEMTHVRTVQDISTFVPKIATASSVGKTYTLSKQYDNRPR